MARGQRTPPPDGTPMRQLYDAVSAAYPRSEAFAEAVAEHANISPGTAKGNYHQVLKLKRRLADGQRAAYVALLKRVVPAKTLNGILDEIETRRRLELGLHDPAARDLLQAVEGEVADLKRALAKAHDAVVALTTRVEALEAQAGRRGRTVASNERGSQPQ